MKINEIEISDLSNFNYKELSISETRKMLESTFCEKVTCNIFLKQKVNYKSIKKAYLYEQEGFEFLILFLFVNDFLEVHFINLTLGSVDEDLNILKNASKLFSFILTITMLLLIDKRYKIKIIAPNIKRAQFYKRIIQRLIKKYDINYTFKILKNEIQLIPKSMGFRELLRKIKELE